MELDDDHIKDLFSSKLTHFEPEVPDAIWSKIETKLNTVSPVTTKIAFRTKVVRIAVATSAIAAMFIAILYLLPQPLVDTAPRLLSKKDMYDTNFLIDNLSKQLSDKKIAQASLPKIDSSNPKSGITTKQYSKQNARMATNQSKHDRSQNIFTQLDSTHIVEPSELTAAQADDSPIRDNNIASNTKELDDDIAAKIAAFKAEGENQKNLLAQNDNTAKRSSSEKLGLGINGGSSVSSSDQFNREYKAPYADAIPLRSTKTVMKHNQPITFGITISKQISPKLSIESGITYAYLSSKLGAGETNDFKKKDMQYFHYLGIPLTLNYSFAQWNKFVFYSSLGGMVQKDLWGRRTAHTYLGSSDSEYSTKEKISQKNPQFSIHGGLGASYPIYRRLRAYTKLGAAYYINANNEYETIYSDRKWLFNFNLGLKFEF